MHNLAPGALQQGRNLPSDVIAKPALMLDCCRSQSCAAAAGGLMVHVHKTAGHPSTRCMGASCFSHGDKAESAQMPAWLCPMSCSMQCACRMHSSHQAMGPAWSKECVNGRHMMLRPFPMATSQ